jgi:hypothetical protein
MVLTTTVNICFSYWFRTSHLESSTYAVGAILAISAIDRVENTEPVMTIRYIQIVPAVPPFESGTSSPTIVITHPLPKSSEYPNMERKRKFL